MLLICLAAAPARAATWLAVSDIHLNPYDTRAQPSTYGKDTNWTLWSATLAAMHRAAPHPAVILVTGDMLEHHFPRDRALAESTMRRIARSLRATFPGVPIVVALGNNEDPCGDYHPTGSGPYLDALSTIWNRPLADEGHYIAGVRGVARFVVLDDVYWSSFYHPCSKSAVRAGARAMSWFAGALAATSATSPAVVVAHIPPGTDVMGTLYAHRFLIFHYLRSPFEREMLQALTQNASRIAFAVVGHAHRSDFRLLASVPEIIVPSVSPIFGNNPAFVTLSVGKNERLADYTLHAYAPAQRTWSAIFDFDRVFGVGTIDAATMAQAHDEIQTSMAVRHAWENAYVAGSRRQRLNGATWRTAWCAQTEAGFAFEQCAGLGHRLLVIPVVGGLLAIVILASLASIALWYARK